MSVTVVNPAKAVGQNEMPFGRDTHIVPSSIVLDRDPSPPQEGIIWGQDPQSKFAMQTVAKLSNALYSGTIVDPI